MCTYNYDHYWLDCQCYAKKRQIKKEILKKFKYVLNQQAFPFCCSLPI